MTLKQETTQIVDNPSKYLTLVYGPAGVGKTSWGMQIPGHYFLLTEMGVEGVEIFGEPVLNWEGFIEKCTEIVEAKEKGFPDQRIITTIVIDTLDNLYEYAGDWICKNITFAEKGVRVRVAKIEDAPYGKGYKETNKLLIITLNKIMLHGLGVVLISHTKDREIAWAGQKFPVNMPNLIPSAVEAVVSACGAVGYFAIDEIVRKNEQGQVERVEQSRYQYWQPNFLILAKHRLRNFPERLLLEMDKGYTTYVAAFQETLSKKKDSDNTDKT